MRVYYLTVLVISGLASAITSYAGSIVNIVSGDGCASTCINGRCESVCGDGKGVRVTSFGIDDSGPAISREFDFSDFDSLIINNVNAEVRFGEKWSVIAHGTESCVKNMSITLEPGTSKPKVLRLAMAGSCSTTVTPRVLVSMPSLSSLSADGNSDVELADFDLESVNLDVSDNVDLLGYSNRFANLYISSNDNADIDLHKSAFFNANVAIAGQSDVKLRHDRAIDGTKNGSIAGTVLGMSDLQYCGLGPQSLEIADMADATQISCDVSN